jgi:hypothetical protein
MSIETLAFAPGTRVQVTQQLPAVLRYRQSKTGSWFAHGLHDRLWLDRLELRKDDGEVVVLNLDQYTVIVPVG